MNWLVFHIACGAAFFSGVALLLLSAALSCWDHWLLKRARWLMLAVGAIAIAVSSTPLPYWPLATAIAISVARQILLWREQWQNYATIAFVAIWTFAAAWEGMHWVTPTARPVSVRSLTIIGDSVTAGTGTKHEVTWPTLFAEQHDVHVQDLSGSGFTTAQALQKARTEGIDSPLVFVEIGGNDMLHGQSASVFREDLEALLALLTEHDRQVVMLELPLIPFHGNYGRAQRSLAKKYGVHLVPKYVFLSILAPEDATLDTIHLTPAGHQQMSDRAWDLVSDAYEN